MTQVHTAFDKKKLTGIPKGLSIIYKGQIPRHWNQDVLSNHASVKYGISSPLNRSLESGIPILAMPNVNVKGEFVLDEVPFIESEKVKEKDILKKGDLLFNWRNGSESHVGKTAFFDLEGVYTHVGFLLRIRMNGRLNDFFLYSYLNFIRAKGYFTKSKIQVNNSFNKEELLNLPIIYPPKHEQEKIAAILTTWDSTIEQNQKLLEKLQLRRKGLMQQLLTGKTRLSGYNGDWVEYTYDSLLKDVSRPVEWDDDELYDLISVKRRSGGLFHRESLYGKQILTKGLKTARVGDFLISKMQIVHGASGLTTVEFDGMKISGSYIAVKAKNEKILDIEFFSWLSKMPYFYHQTFIASYGVHIEKMTFNYKSFLKLRTSLPPIEEQRAIVKILSTSDTEIQAQKEYLEQLQLQKKGIMQILLTGKIQVKIDGPY